MCPEGGEVVRIWVQCYLVESMAKVHFRVMCDTFEEMPDFLYGFHMVGCSFEGFVGLSYVDGHYDLLLVFLFHDNYISDPRAVWVKVHILNSILLSKVD